MQCALRALTRHTRQGGLHPVPPHRVRCFNAHSTTSTNVVRYFYPGELLPGRRLLVAAKKPFGE